MYWGLAIFLAVFLSITAWFGLKAMRMLRMHTRHTKGAELLRVSTGLTFGTRYMFTAPKGVGEVDLFLRYKRTLGHRRGEDIVLHLHGPVSREFTLRLRSASRAEVRVIFSGVVPGQYEVELVGASPAELLELLAVGHPAGVPAQAS